MISLRGNKVLFDLEVGDQKLDKDFVKNNSIQIYGYRAVFTAGFALPTFHLIIASTNKEYLEKFKENNKIVIHVGSDVEHMDSFECDTVGKHIKNDAQHVMHVLYWGGVLSKNKLNSKFLKDKEDGCYTGNALKATVEAWHDITGCDVKNETGKENTPDQERHYRRHRKTANNFLVNTMLHMDLRPSFPLVTINRNGDLLLRDFVTMKSNGAKHKFVPSGHAASSEIPYTGALGITSFKAYSNRYLGYRQISGRNTETGKNETAGSSITDENTGWALNKLATTSANEINPIEHVANENDNLHISSDTPLSYHEVELFNKAQTINMSSIQGKIRVDGMYMNNVDVLDVVNVVTGVKEDKDSGLYIVEAVEQGFIEGVPFGNIFYLCRDNFNDVETTQTDSYSKQALRDLKVSPKEKTGIVNAVRASRRGLIHARSIMDGEYIRTFEAHLISMKSSALSNFNMNNTTIDFNERSRAINSLKASGVQLVNGIISKFVKSPYDKMLFNSVLGNQSLMNLLLGLLSSVMGAELYGEFRGLLGDLQYFDNFLKNYNNRVRVAQYKSSPNYVEDWNRRNIVFRETPSGNIVWSDADSSINYVIKEDTSMGISAEEKEVKLNRIISSITQTIPESVDLPIPEITLDDTEAIKPDDELKKDIVSGIVEDLIEKGYVYDSTILGGDEYEGIDLSAGGKALTSTNSIFMANGERVSYNYARENMLSSEILTQILQGNRLFDSTSATKLKNAIGTQLYVRHWGSFTNMNELASFNINSGYREKYKSVGFVKHMSVRGGKRIYIVLPAKEQNLKFYIGSQRVSMNQMEYSDIGYKTNTGVSIPYIVYYTTEAYNSSNLMIEVRRGV